MARCIAVGYLVFLFVTPILWIFRKAKRVDGFCLFFMGVMAAAIIAVSVCLAGLATTFR